MILSNLFDERPIWPKESLTERLLDKSLSFTVEMLRRCSAWKLAHLWLNTFIGSWNLT